MKATNELKKFLSTDFYNLLNLVFFLGNSQIKSGLFFDLLLMSEVLTFEISNAELKRKTRIFGKMDVYAVVQINQQRFETKICKGGDKNPRWNQTFEATVDSGHYLITEVWERADGKHVLIGNGRHILPEINNDVGQLLWIPVFHNQKAAGKILLNLISRRPNLVKPAASQDNTPTAMKNPEGENQNLEEVVENKIEEKKEEKIKEKIEPQVNNNGEEEVKIENNYFAGQNNEEPLFKKDVAVAAETNDNVVERKIKPFFSKLDKCFGTDFTREEIGHLKAIDKEDKEIQCDLEPPQPEKKRTRDIDTQCEEIKVEIPVPIVVKEERGSQTRDWDEQKREVILEHQIQIKKREREARWASIPRQRSTVELPTSYLEMLTLNQKSIQKKSNDFPAKKQHDLSLDRERPKFQLPPFKKREQPDEKYSQSQRLAYLGNYLVNRHAPVYDFYDLE